MMNGLWVELVVAVVLLGGSSTGSAQDRDVRPVALWTFDDNIGSAVAMWAFLDMPVFMDPDVL